MDPIHIRWAFIHLVRSRCCNLPPALMDGWMDFVGPPADDPKCDLCAASLFLCCCLLQHIVYPLRNLCLFGNKEQQGPRPLYSSAHLLWLKLWFFEHIRRAIFSIFLLFLVVCAMMYRPFLSDLIFRFFCLVFQSAFGDLNICSPICATFVTAG
jgi:hypothetical protein